MSDDVPYTQAQLMAKVSGILGALATESPISAAASEDALAFVAAVLLDMDPSVTAPSHLRKAAEQHGSRVFTYLKHLRKHFETTGVRYGEAIGGSVLIDSGLLPELTKGMTKQ